MVDDGINLYIDQLYSAFTNLNVGDNMHIDLEKLGYKGDGELVIPMYFLEKFSSERVRLGISGEPYYIKKESGSAGIYFAK